MYKTGLNPKDRQFMFYSSQEFVVGISLSKSLELVAKEMDWSGGQKLESLVQRLEGFRFDAPCGVFLQFELDFDKKGYGVSVALSANGGNYVEITDCLSFRQTEVEGFGDRILDKDLIAATIISIGSCSRLDPGFIPFMSRYVRSSDCQLLSHGLSAGTHVGGFGIQWLESCGSDRIDPIHVDNSWTFYYVHVTSGAWGKFAFPPSGWECTLRTSEEIAPEDGMQRQLVKVIELDLYGVGSLSVCLDADWPGLDDG